MKTCPNAVPEGSASYQDPFEYDGSTRLMDSAATKSIFGNRSDMWLWRRIKDGTLPQPLVISGRRYWRADEIDKLIARLSNERAAT